MSRMTRRELNRTLAVSVAGAWTGHSKAVAKSLSADPESHGSITDVPGIRVGHFTETRRPTGCTAILFDTEAAAGVDYDGSAPGSELGVMLQPVSPVETIHGLVLTGGAPMGLAAVAGAVQYLEEHGVGFHWGGPNIYVPLVVGAVIADLELGDGRIRPGPEAAYKACAAASSEGSRGCRWAARGPWHLGRYSRVVRGAGIAWTVFICIILVMPPNQRAGITMLGLTAFLVAWYGLFERRRLQLRPAAAGGKGSASLRT